MCGGNAECGQCPYFNSHAVDERCIAILLTDAFANFQQFEHQVRDLTKKVEQLERERDAAIADLAEKPRCENCKHFTPGYFCIGCRRGERWEWRGVQEVE